MALDLNNLAYPFDPTGERQANKVTGEQHILRGSDYRDYYFFIPDMAPYFADSLVVSFKSNNGEVRVLKAGIDYYHTHWFVAASLACAKPIFGSITILNRQLQGIATISYQTVGGDWVIPMDRIAAILADRLNNPRSTTWDRVAQMPYNFPVIDHEWDFADMVGGKELVDGVIAIEKALLFTGASGITEHMQNVNNPHETTAFQVGLGNVRNLPTATTAQAEAGVSDNVYMTPLSTMALVSVKALTPLNAHTSNISNPHGTTAAQVGAYSIDQMNQLLAGRVAVDGVAADATRFGGRLPAEYTAMVLTGTAANASKFGGQTPTEFKAEVAQMTVLNSMQLSGYTLEQIMAGSTIYNSVRFNSQTAAEFKAEIAGSTVANSLKLAGQTTAELLSAGTAGNSEKFAGRTIDQFKNELGGGLVVTDSNRLGGFTLAEILAGSTILNATRFNGQTSPEFKAEMLASTVANSTRLGGQTAAELMAGTVANATLFGGKSVAEFKAELAASTLTNANQLGGYTLDQILAGSTIYNTTRFDGQTSAEFKAEIAASTVANATRLGGKTAAEILTAGTAGNATLFGGKTAAEFKTELAQTTVVNSGQLGGFTLAEILAGSTIYNATHFNGQTSPEFKAEMLASTIANSAKLGGYTLAEILAGSTIANSDKLAGRTLDQLKAEIIGNGNGGTSNDTLRFGGQLPAEFTASVLAGTAANASRLGGKTAAELLTTGTAGNTILFDGRTTAAWKEEVRLQTSSNSDRLGGQTASEIMSGTSGATNTFGGMTAEAFRNSVLGGTAGNATRFNNRTAAEFTSDVLAGTAANATRLNGRTDVETATWVLAGTAANASKFDGMTVNDFDSRYAQRFTKTGEAAPQGVTIGATGSGANDVWVELGDLSLPEAGNKSSRGDTHWLVAGGEPITTGLKSPLHSVRLSMDANGVVSGFIHSLTDSTVPVSFGYSTSGTGPTFLATIWAKCKDSRTNVTVTELAAGNGGVSNYNSTEAVQPAGYVNLPVSSLYASASDVEAALTAMTAAFTTLAQQLTA